MKKQYTKRCAVLAVLLISVFIGLFSQIGLAQSEIYTYDGTLTISDDALDRGIITDDQWKFYVCEVNYQEMVSVNLSYSGNVDLDLRLYVSNVPVNQEVMAWDITHSGYEGTDFVDISPTRNSQIRGTTAIETLTYRNENFLEARDVYILVFCYEGLGDSEYTLSSNITVSEVSPKLLRPSEEYNAAWTSYFIATGITLAVLVLGGNYLKIPQKERKLMKIQKKEEKRQKAKEKARLAAEKSSSKKNVSMKKRAKSGRRI